jgi:hypothetical protein
MPDNPPVASVPAARSGSLNMADLLKFNDVSAAAVGALWGGVFAGAPGSQAVMSLVTSITARILSQLLLAGKLESLSESGKNQILVALVSGIIAYVQKKGVGKAMLGGMAIDLIADDILQQLKIKDESPFGTK